MRRPSAVRMWWALGPVSALGAALLFTACAPPAQLGGELAPRVVSGLDRYVKNSRSRKRSMELVAGRGLRAVVRTVQPGPARFEVFPDDAHTLYVLRGRLRVTIAKGKPFTVRSGELIYIPPTIPVRIAALGGVGKVLVHETRKTGRRDSYDAVR